MKASDYFAIGDTVTLNAERLAVRFGPGQDFWQPFAAVAGRVVGFRMVTDKRTRRPAERVAIAWNLNGTEVIRSWKPKYVCLASADGKPIEAFPVQ